MKMEKTGDRTYQALVVGAGIGGIRTAIDLAQQGCRVVLIDKGPAAGGLLNQLDFQFPSNHCGMCKLLPLVHRDQSSQFCLRKGLFHDNIDLLPSCELRHLDGEPGNFTVRLHQKPTWVDPGRCVGCGLCEDVCPETVPDCFNEGLSTHKAIYLPIPHAIPNSYVIDLAACSRCGACEDICPTDAVQLSSSDRKAFNILVVDDELSIRDSLKEWLEEEDFSVDMAQSGPEALEKLKTRTYQLMLTDIKMPEMSGTQLLKEVKQAYPDTCMVMMTAYATVETAVEAMKTGALDYLVKPFDPETLIPMVIRIYQDIEASQDREINVDTIVLSTGTSFYDPADEKNLYGYGIYPNVVTGIEFERMISRTGPGQGELTRLDNGGPVKKIAWLQCVGSRDIQTGADYCSSICCMAAMKEAVLAGTLLEQSVETVIFYMDMRTWGKSFQEYYDKAVMDHDVRFERCKIHSLNSTVPDGDLVIRYLSKTGELEEEIFDMVVLSTGQRPGSKTLSLSRTCDVPLNDAGFFATRPFSAVQSQKEGILVSGSAGGLTDISESIIRAGAAARCAGQFIDLPQDNVEENEDTGRTAIRDVSREPVSVLVAVCTCAGRLNPFMDPGDLAKRLESDPDIAKVVFIDQVCTAAGWEEFSQEVSKSRANRILTGACHPYVFLKKIKSLAQDTGLDPSLMEVADIMTPVFNATRDELHPPTRQQLFSVLSQGIESLKSRDPVTLEAIDIHQRVMVIGGGIAGMTAALAVADAGCPVDLVEKSDQLGGNLNWLGETLEGLSLKDFKSDTVKAVQQHSVITVHMQSRLVSFEGSAGRFHATIETGENKAVDLMPGAVILATGGHEAGTTAFGHGDHAAVVTQKELEINLAENRLAPEQCRTVVMIQCVESRMPDSQNYCSRVCCPTALKHANLIKKLNPDADIYILYRDMMTCGFSEVCFTKAREDNIIFMAYDPESLPGVEIQEDTVHVTLTEPVLQQPVNIEADLLVLATGIVPELPEDLAAILGIEADSHGFFKEAESKWRPLDALREGIFACGIVQAPRSAVDAADTGRAAAQRAITLVSNPVYTPDRQVARVRHSLCSLCERCIDACPYGARTLNMDRTKIQVNGIMCQGCGACAAVCPNGAAILPVYSSRRMLSVIDAAFETLEN